ncbi:uncharacterized protein [Dysidea avara]|uniref:uncharacterized protein n=1 Tax=Dysidea avara TaxID=196820 RepID=UPI00332DAEB5
MALGSWQTLKTHEDPRLKQLAEGLYDTVLRGKAASTTKKYLEHLGEIKGSKAAIEEAVNALAWAHSLSGLPSPTASPFVQIVLDGLRRAHAKEVKKKEPFTVEMLKAITDDAIQTDSLADTRLAAACLLAFTGFLRYDEISNIRQCEIQFKADHISIKIPKADQLRQGDQVVIARTNSTSCPIAMLDRYMVKAKIPADSSLFSSAQ